MSIAVVGAGAFGTALAIVQAARGPVTLLARSADHAEAMRRTRENAQRLPGVPLPEAVRPTADSAALADARIVLFAVPTQSLGEVARAMPVAPDAALVACCKGIDLATGRGPSRVLAEACPGRTVAVLTGPSFADDIARGLPTGLTIATAEEAEAIRLQERLTTGTFRLYRTTDVTGAELGGALKNVIAIACGAVIGAGYGVSARATILTRGFGEMRTLAEHLGARPATLLGLSGLGDLTLTCTSDLSRNYRHGRALGSGAPVDQSATVEGVKTARAAATLAAKAGLDLPILRMTADFAEGRIGPEDALQSLLARDLKAE